MDFIVTKGICCGITIEVMYCCVALDVEVAIYILMLVFFVSDDIVLML